MDIRERPSPNFNDRPDDGTGIGRVDTLILHYTGMCTAKESLDRLCDPAAKVSAHYQIDEDGTVWRLVAEEKRAWHAGASFWRGRRDINDVSIGIELVNPGHEFGYRAFPEAQMTAIETLARGILARHTIPPRYVLGHSDIAPSRKQDPGELFDWPRLARAGIGFWPDFAVNTASEGNSIAEIQRQLAQIGYDCPQTGVLDSQTAAVIIAFQRHYRPERCDGVADPETAARIAVLAQGIS